MCKSQMNMKVVVKYKHFREQAVGVNCTLGGT